MNMKGVMYIVILLIVATLLVLPVSAALSVTDISPDKGNNTGWVYVDIRGTEFPDSAHAGVNLVGDGSATIPGQYLHRYDASWISAFFDVTGKEAGAWTVVVVNMSDGSEASSPGPFLIENLPPTVRGISPGSAVNIQTDVGLTITGSDFLPGAMVKLTNGTTSIQSVNPLVESKTELFCSINLTGAAGGRWSVEVTNTDGKTGILKDGFMVLNPAPAVTSIDPDSGKNTETVAINNLAGTGFLEGVSVVLRKSGQPDIPTIGTPVLDNPSKILCFFNLNGAPVGDWDVVVTNVDGQSGTLPGGFFIRYPQPPSISAVEPVTGVNTGVVHLTNITGAGFQEGATVLLNKTGQADIIAPGVVISSNHISCDLDITDALTGKWNIIVINDDGQSSTLSDAFAVSYPAARVTGVNPPTGINNIVIPVAITGAYFQDNPIVTLSREGCRPISATTINREDSTRITCKLPIIGADVGIWSLVVTNPDGQSSNALNFTVENPPPHPLSITPQKGPNDNVIFITNLSGTGFLPGASVQLTKSGQAPIYATEIEVTGDGSIITCRLNLTDKEPGTWNVIVNNSDGKTGPPVTFTVTPPLPVPKVTASPVFGSTPLTVYFKDLSTNNPTQWRWDFGDGSVLAGNCTDKADSCYSTMKNPVHTYDMPGVYEAKLVVYNIAGWNTAAANVSITVVDTPIANFTAAPASGPAPLFVQFTDTSDGDPYRWVWKFGDGQISDEQNPYFLYKNPGHYLIELTVYNKAGSDTTTGAIDVFASVPVATFTANRTSGDSPLAVQFFDTSSGAPTGWAWKFGDSGSATVQNPVHVFSTPGTYGVQLTVSNAAGTSTETKHGYIVVGEPIKANFEYTPSNPGKTAPLTVAFSDMSTGNVMKWSWNFGDGHISNERNPIHTYPAPGTYDITLSVVGLTGHDSFTRTITVVSPLDANFIASPTTGSVPLTVTFSDISVGAPVTRNWIIVDYSLPAVTTFEDGPRDLTYTFNKPGDYDVWLQIKDQYNGIDIEQKHNYIHVIPFP